MILLSGVYFLMRDSVVIVGKRLAANLALVWFFSCVESLVLISICRLGKTLSTNTALEFFLLSKGIITVIFIVRT